MPGGYLAITAIFKWEWPWLAEWIVYHRQVGVQHFFLCANEEGEDLRRSMEILRPFVAAGLVTCHSLNGPGNQCWVYNRVIEQTRGRFRWLAAIDIDEFLYPVQTQTVSEVLRDYEQYPTLAVNWQCFGSSHLAQRPTSQIGGFLWRAPQEWEVNQHIKTIADPARVTRWVSPHRTEVPAVDENFKKIEGPFNWFTGRRLLVNHYVVRSRQDFAEVKIPRGLADGTGGSRSWSFWDEHDRNDVFDDTFARRFSVQVNAELERWRTNPPPSGYFLRGQE